MPQLKVNQIADAAVLAATTNYTFTADFFRVVSVQAVYTAATVSATATLQYSLDNATWADFTTATSIAASGNKAWIVDTTDAPYWQVKYTHTSGSSTTFKVYVAHIQRT